MLITETEARKEALLPIGNLPTDESVAPTFKELFSAGMRTQNTFASAGQAIGARLERRQAVAREQALGGAKPYNVYEDLEGYEEYAQSFQDVQIQEDAAVVKRRIDQENSDRELLYVGGLEGFAAQLAAGVVDPVNLIPIGTAARSTSILGGAAQTAVAGAAVATVAEIGLQASQETRTAEETALTIGATTLLSGILGGAAPLVRGGISRLAGRVEREMELPLPSEPDPMAPRSQPLGSVGAAAVNISEAKLKSAMGVEKVTGFVSPILRTLQSPSVETRRIAQDLVESPFYFTDTAEGVATPIATETRIKMWQGPLADALVDMDTAFAKYKKGGGEMNFKAFREEVGRAMRRSDESVVPEVSAAAKSMRSKLFEPTKAEAIALKLLPEDVEVKTASSYFTRVYDNDKIVARRPEWINTVTDWLVGQHRNIDRLELKEIAEQITDTILGVPQGRLMYDAVPLKRGPLKERVFDIPDELIEDYLESDAQTIAMFYTRTMAPDLELTRSFGRADMEEQIAKITESYRDLISNANTDKARKELNARRDDDIRDIEAMRDRLRGTYGMPSDPSGVMVRTGRFIRNWNYLSMLGGMTVSSIPDLARPVMVHGIMQVMKSAIVPMVKNFRKFRIAGAEAKKAGTALEMVLDSRSMSMADIGDVYGRHTQFERGTQYLVENFGKVTLMSPWNAALKQFASVITQDRVLTAALKGGGMSKREIEYMALSGINENTAQRIAEQFRKHGTESDGVKLANTQAWTDREAIDAYRAAIVKDVDRVIVTPGVGDRPLWTSNEMGKMIAQFKTFAFASTQRVLISGLQQRDMAVLNGTLLSTALGMGVYYLKTPEERLSDDPIVWVLEGVDRSGVMGWLYEANNMMEKATSGRVGINRLVGGTPSSRYASRGPISALFGPSVGRIEDAVQAGSSLSMGELTEADHRAMRRLLPYQNVFYLRGILDQAHEGAKEVFE